MKELNEQIRRSMNYDPLAEAEKIAGKSWKEDDQVGFLGMAMSMAHGEEKDSLLALNDDTRCGTSMGEYKRIAGSLGFRLLTEEPTVEGNTLCIWWRDDGLLMAAEGYAAGKRINSAKVWFNFKGQRNSLEKCSNGHAGKSEGMDVWSGDFDAREGLRFQLENITSGGEFLPCWIRQPFLWLLSYSDTNAPDYDYNAINSRRLAKLPIGIQEAVLFPPSVN